MDCQKILDQLADGVIEKYEVEPEDAFAFQEALRKYSRKQDITGRALRRGKIVYVHAKMDQ